MECVARSVAKLCSHCLYRSDSDRTCARQVIPADFHDGFSEYWIGVEDRDGDGVYQWLSDNRTVRTVCITSGMYSIQDREIRAGIEGA